MAYVMRIVGLVAGDRSPFDGQFLKEYDPDRRGTDPQGRPMLAHIVCVPDPLDAKQFKDAAEAMETWREVSGRWPRRPYDGKPNRPLTAFTVQIDRTDLAKHGR